MNEINGVPYRQELLKRSDNRPNESMTPKYLTVHETGNTDAGADAEATNAYMHNGSGGRKASWHVTVDDKEAIQSLRWREQGWHAGDGAGPGNTTSIGMEVCVNKTGPERKKAWDNAARVAAYLIEQFDLEPVQHNHWSNKNCPMYMRRGEPMSWQDFLVQVQGYREGTPKQEVDEMDKDAVRAIVAEMRDNGELRDKRLREVFENHRLPKMLDGLEQMHEAIGVMMEAMDVNETGD